MRREQRSSALAAARRARYRLALYGSYLKNPAEIWIFTAGSFEVLPPVENLETGECVESRGTDSFA